MKNPKLIAATIVALHKLLIDVSNHSGIICEQILLFRIHEKLLNHIALKNPVDSIQSIEKTEADFNYDLIVMQICILINCTEISYELCQDMVLKSDKPSPAENLVQMHLTYSEIDKVGTYKLI